MVVSDRLKRILKRFWGRGNFGVLDPGEGVDPIRSSNLHRLLDGELGRSAKIYQKEMLVDLEK